MLNIKCKKLSKRNEPLYALTFFGPIFLNLFIAVYILNAFNDSGMINFFGLNSDIDKAIVVTTIFSVLTLVSRIIDCLLNIPMAALSDKCRNRLGSRKPGILIGGTGITIMYILMCVPISYDYHSMANTFYIFVILLIYFASYAFCSVSFFATFAEVCPNTASRIRVTHWKAAYDTIAYSIAYALIPLIFNFYPHFQTLGLIFTVLVLTLIVPFFFDISGFGMSIVQKTEKKDEYNFFKGFKIAFSNKNFIIWICIFAFFYFGLDLFLLSQTAIASSGMALNPWQISVMNSAAFAPIPLMLLLNNFIIKRKGFAFTFRMAIASFLISMSLLSVAYVHWIPSHAAIFSIAILASTVGSFGIGSFFSFPYMVPGQIAAEENHKTKSNNSALFYGVQGILVALSSALNDPVWFSVSKISSDKAIGAHVCTYIVVGVSAISLIASFFLPKYFRDIGKHNVKR